MNIKLKSKDPLTTASYKIPPDIKKDIDEISKKEGITQGELVRSFLQYSLEAYQAGKVQKVWGEVMMDHFRKQVKKGDEVIAAGIFGKIKNVTEMFFEIQVSPGVSLKVIKDELTDILNPRKEVLKEMERYKKELAAKANA